MSGVKLIDQLAAEERLERPQWIELLTAYQDAEVFDYLAGKSGAVRQKIFGRKVFLRALIELSNHCKNDCLYCGLRRSNRKAQRYRLDRQEVLDCCATAYNLGLRTFVLQGGEDPAYVGQRLVDLVGDIRTAFPDCAITLSLGEMETGLYRQLAAAGADRYLLRHETADSGHYAALHPPEMSFAGRRRCLFELKALGFQVGAGFMIGSPGQTFEALAEDFIFLKELDPQMIGVGPFIPHPQTPLGQNPPGPVNLSLFILGLLRLMSPESLLPATTALATLDPAGRELALELGANVLMPNVSPPNARAKYEIYAGKAHWGQEAAEGLASLKARLSALGFQTPVSRGDYRGSLDSKDGGRGDALETGPVLAAAGALD